MRYRTALLGIVIGSALLIGFTSALGMSAWLGLAFFLLYFAFAIAITRMRAELGTPVNDLTFTGPDWTISDLVGQRSLGAHNLVGLSQLYWFNRAYRAHPAPVQLESLKLASEVRAAYSQWLWTLYLAGVVGFVAGVWAMLHANYAYGAHAKAAWTFGSETYNRLSGWLRDPRSEERRVGK